MKTEDLARGDKVIYKYGGGYEEEWTVVGIAPAGVYLARNSKYNEAVFVRESDDQLPGVEPCQ